MNTIKKFFTVAFLLAFTGLITVIMLGVLGGVAIDHDVLLALITVLGAQVIGVVVTAFKTQGFFRDDPYSTKRAVEAAEHRHAYTVAQLQAKYAQLEQAHAELEQRHVKILTEHSDLKRQCYELPAEIRPQMVERRFLQ